MVDKEFWDDLQWGEQHHTEFLKKYKDQWVAIHNKSVIASGNNLAGVGRQARSKTGKQKIPLIYVECGEHIYGQG
ncbi:MAG TPA: DUF5678 domain-containing protein [Candidatus Nanoarchaeia archaeon]|nr:DUF5678 domain-containing protein [Candidatus Nanoarchaeia archaeon]